MSNFNRKVKKNKTTKKIDDSQNMIESYDTYIIGSSEDSGVIIETSSYNKRFFKDTKHMLNTYGLVIQDFINFKHLNSGGTRLIDFMKDSVENNYMLSDSLNDCEYVIDEEKIIFIDRCSEKQIYFNMGEFFIDHYQVNVCESNLFLEDLESSKKYMYYGD